MLMWGKAYSLICAPRIALIEQSFYLKKKPEIEDDDGTTS